MRLPTRPTVYEINTAVWLERLGRQRGRALTLSEVPGDRWDALAALPVDAVWLRASGSAAPPDSRSRSAIPTLTAAIARQSPIYDPTT